MSAQEKLYQKIQSLGEDLSYHAMAQDRKTVFNIFDKLNILQVKLGNIEDKAVKADKKHKKDKPRKTRKNRLSEKDIERIKKLREKGKMTVAEIAEKFGISTFTVYSHTR